MAVPYGHKRSAVTGKTPVAGDFAKPGQILVNTADGRAFINATGGVKTLPNTDDICSRPLGRLSFTTSPVSVSDVSSASTLYYVQDVGNTVPVWNGTSYDLISFTSASLSFSATSGHSQYHAPNKNFDVYAFKSGNSLGLGTGPAWATDVSRGASNAITRRNGLWVNQNSLQLRTGSASGNVASVPAERATLLGTVRIGSVAGQSHWQINPTRAIGGTNNKLFLSNIYNLRAISAKCRFQEAFWTIPAGTGTRASNGSAGSAIHFIQSVSDFATDAEYTSVIEISVAGAVPRISIGLDSSSVAASNAPLLAGPLGINAQLTAKWSGFSGMGLHSVISQEANSGTGMSNVGAGTSDLTILSATVLL